jgi:hypothetical protein
MCEHCPNTDFTDTRAIPAMLSGVHRRITRHQVSMPFWLAVLAEGAA